MVALAYSWAPAPAPASAPGPSSPAACGRFAGWLTGRSLPDCTRVTGRLAASGPPAIVVTYHHANGPRWRPDARLRRAMAQLVALRSSAQGLQNVPPGPVLVEHWAFPDERRLPSRQGEAVGPEHINGGCTRAGGTIYCFRQEDYPKVWLHEGVHCFGLDLQPYPDALVRRLRRLLPTASPLLPNEAWTELLATAHTTAFRVRAGVGTPAWSRAWEQECAHALERAAALLAHMGYASAGELFHRVWRERTNALAYIVLRAAVMPLVEGWTAVRRPEDLHRLLDGGLRSPAFLAKLQAELDRRRGPDGAPSSGQRFRMTLHS